MGGIELKATLRGQSLSGELTTHLHCRYHAFPAHMGWGGSLFTIVIHPANQFWLPPVLDWFT